MTRAKGGCVAASWRVVKRGGERHEVVTKLIKINEEEGRKKEELTPLTLLLLSTVLFSVDKARLLLCSQVRVDALERASNISPLMYVTMR